MTDGEVRAEDVDALDAAWDDLIFGRSNQAPAVDVADAATLRALGVLVDVSPPAGRRIWSNALAQAAEPRSQQQVRAMTQGKRAMHLVAPSTPGWGWLPAGVIAVAASLAILGGVFFAGSDGDDTARTHPGDASSVVATLASAAPAWATPGGEVAD